MSLPERLTVIAAMVGGQSRAFGRGWANGMARWECRTELRDEANGQFLMWSFFPPPTSWPRGSVERAASEAAVAYMQEKTL